MLWEHAQTSPLNDIHMQEKPLVFWTLGGINVEAQEL